jgi:hypothetical protein
MNSYYPVIARAVERLDRNTVAARRELYERARKAVAQLCATQPALLDADITKECLALEEAIRKVEAEAARNSATERRAEPPSAGPSGGMSNDVPSASEDGEDADIQAVAIGGSYGANNYHEHVPDLHRRGGLLVGMAVIALTALASTFVYRTVFVSYTFSALPRIGNDSDNVLPNGVSTQTSITSAYSAKNCSRRTFVRRRKPSRASFPQSRFLPDRALR